MNKSGLIGKIENILIIRRNNIGDMICAIPVFKAIRNQLPNARITVLAEKTNSIIIKGAPFIDHLIVYNKGNGIFRNKYLNFWKLIRQNKVEFDLVIVLKAGFSSTSSLMAMISGARFRMGCLPESWHPLQFCYNLPLKVQESWHPLHIKDIFLEMIKNIGITASEKDISFEIPEESKERVHSFFKINSIQKADNIVVFNISNNRPDTMWPVERFKETAEIISNEYDAVFIITSIPADKDRAVTLSKEIKKGFYFDEVAKVMDFAALVSEAGVLICGEGGAMHIGASVNTPTVSLWGGTASVANWMHREENQFMVRTGKYVNSISGGDVLEVIRKNKILK